MASLFEACNAAMVVRARSFRARQNAAIRGVMPVGKGAAIACQACLSAKRFLSRWMPYYVWQGTLDCKLIRIEHWQWFETH